MEDHDVILLDEPFNALDDENLRIACENIHKQKENGKIIVIAAHGEIPKECGIDKIIKIVDGKLI